MVAHSIQQGLTELEKEKAQQYLFTNMPSQSETGSFGRYCNALGKLAALSRDPHANPAEYEKIFSQAAEAHNNLVGESDEFCDVFNRKISSLPYNATYAGKGAAGKESTGYPEMLYESVFAEFIRRVTDKAFERMENLNDVMMSGFNKKKFHEDMVNALYTIHRAQPHIESSANYDVVATAYANMGMAFERTIGIIQGPEQRRQEDNHMKLSSMLIFNDMRSILDDMMAADKYSVAHVGLLQKMRREQTSLNAKIKSSNVNSADLTKLIGFLEMESLEASTSANPPASD